jgi:HSP20 family protein
MYQTRNFNSRMPRSFSGFIEDVLQNGKVFSDELWNDDTMRVPVNIIENEKEYSLMVVAPGLKKEDIKINLEKEVLSISFEEIKDEKTEEKGKVIRSEYKFKSFKRSFTLNDKIDTTSINAKYADGILTVTLPKKEEAAPENKTINIA